MTQLGFSVVQCRLIPDASFYPNEAADKPLRPDLLALLAQGYRAESRGAVSSCDRTQCGGAPRNPFPSLLCDCWIEGRSRRWP